MKNIIVAYDNERAIGKNGDLLWKPGEMRGDMAHFRTLTMGSAIIMGRKTLDSIGMALQGRRNIVLSRSESTQISGVEVVRSLDEAYSLADKDEGVFIIGGGEIYQQALKDVERIYATEIDTTVEGADIFFPSLDSNWQKTDMKKFSADENNIYPYSFVTYERK